MSLVEDLIATCSDSIRELLSLRGRIALVSANDMVVVCKKFDKKFDLDKAELLVRKFYA